MGLNRYELTSSTSCPPSNIAACRQTDRCRGYTREETVIQGIGVRGEGPTHHKEGLEGWLLLQVVEQLLSMAVVLTVTLVDRKLFTLGGGGGEIPPEGFVTLHMHRGSHI